MVCGGGGGYVFQPLHNPPQPLHTRDLKIPFEDELIF